MNINVDKTVVQVPISRLPLWLARIVIFLTFPFLLLSTIVMTHWVVTVLSYKVHRDQVKDFFANAREAWLR